MVVAECRRERAECNRECAECSRECRGGVWPSTWSFAVAVLYALRGHVGGSQTLRIVAYDDEQSGGISAGFSISTDDRNHCRNSAVYSHTNTCLFLCTKLNWHINPSINEFASTGHPTDLRVGGECCPVSATVTVRVVPLQVESEVLEKARSLSEEPHLVIDTLRGENDQLRWVPGRE